MWCVTGRLRGVFSAHAEVVPHSQDNVLLTVSILRARGGSSKHLIESVVTIRYSPRTRR